VEEQEEIEDAMRKRKSFHRHLLRRRRRRLPPLFSGRYLISFGATFISGDLVI